MTSEHMLPPVIACKIVAVEDWPQRYQDIHQKLIDAGEREAREITYPAPGSIKGTCPDCKVGVWIGPRSQDVIEMFKADGHDLATPCVFCASYRIMNENAEATIVPLGNTYRPKLPGDE